MKYVGLLVTLLGFLISVFALSATTSVSGRMIVVLIGIAVSLGGIIGMVNRAYMADAIWRK